LYANNNLRYRDHLVSPYPDPDHTLEVADGMYLLNSYPDTLFNVSNQSPLRPVKEYLYSDMDFYYMYWMVERITGAPLDAYVQDHFYSRLGATTTGFLPLRRFLPDQVAPTENDRVFRQQVVLGYVHDPGAAMMGGVCGHAGLFSNANDLAKLMQMYLNKGMYGGETYFQPATLDYFSSCPFCKTNRRGIGFDRPVMNSKIGPTCQCVSAKSFGHTGFTGTMTWVDPETGLLYVFLSNRVYPDAENHKINDMNIRTRIQEVIHNSLNTFQ
jgi:CubicO group peptidase (beta-lactamase class C family)